MTNTATTQETANLNNKIENLFVQQMHIAYREQHNKHVPYAQLKKAFAKAGRKWSRKSTVLQTIGVVGDTMDKNELIKMYHEIGDAAANIIAKQTGLKLAD